MPTCANNTTKCRRKSMKGHPMQLHVVAIACCSHSLPGAEIFAGGFPEEAADRTTGSTGISAKLSDMNDERLLTCMLNNRDASKSGR